MRHVLLRITGTERKRKELALPVDASVKSVKDTWLMWAKAPNRAPHQEGKAFLMLWKARGSSHQCSGTWWHGGTGKDSLTSPCSPVCEVMLNSLPVIQMFEHLTEQQKWLPGSREPVLAVAGLTWIMDNQQSVGPLSHSPSQAFPSPPFSHTHGGIQIPEEAGENPDTSRLLRSQMVFQWVQSN